MPKPTKDQLTEKDRALIQTMSETLGLEEGLEDVVRRLKHRKSVLDAAQETKSNALGLELTEGGPVQITGMDADQNLDRGEGCRIEPHLLRGNAKTGELPVAIDFPLPLFPGRILSVRIQNRHDEAARLLVDTSRLNPLSNGGLTFFVEIGSGAAKAAMPQFRALRPDQKEEIELGKGDYAQIVGFRLEPTPTLFHKQIPIEKDDQPVPTKRKGKK